MLSQNRSELAVLRGKRSEGALDKWAEAFGEGSRRDAKRYLDVLDRLTGDPPPGAEDDAYIGRFSPRTRRAYGRIISEFFEWVSHEHRRIVLPREVTRKDAEDYVEWLRTKPFSLEREKLRDGDNAKRLAIYDAVAELGSADLTTIASRLTSDFRSNKPLLHAELGRMVLHDLLDRSPTLAELRKEDPQLGISHFVVKLPRGEVPLEDIFVYQVPKARPLSRSSIAHHLAALSRLWTDFCRGDDHGEPLVRFNVFDDVSARVSRGLGADRRADRARKPRLTPEVIERLLAATEGDSLASKRDAALFWFMVLVGTRVSEARRLTRDKPAAGKPLTASGWLEPRALPVTVELVRKGGFHHRLPYPPYALRSLYAFQEELKRHAAPHGSQSRDPRAPHYLAPHSPAWRYRALADEPDAPLFPPLYFWGANAPGNYEEFKPNATHSYKKPMSAHGIRAILKKLARKAGLSPDEVRMVHSHAFRHFAATAMARRGKNLREIQSILGHASVTETEKYIDQETDLSVLSGQTEILEYIATAKGGTREEPPPAVIETVGVVAPERPAERLPAESPRVSPELARSSAGLVAISEEGPSPPHVTELRGKVSPGSPYYAYADLGTEDDEVRETIHFTRVEPRVLRSPGTVTLYEKSGKDMVQSDKFLAEHYDPWPLGYGIGSTSLLPWFARGSASKNGDVTVTIRSRDGKQRTVVVPPLPVFAGEQLYSEIKAPSLWRRVEELRNEWLRTSPTKAFGLDRWWGAFQEIQRGLARGTKGKFRFVPFDAQAELGRDIRAHDDDYLARWLEKNAERYTATVRAFENIERPRGGARDDEEWQAFKEKFAAASLVGASPAEELPDWFMSSDPVREIYDRDREEFSWFSKWIASITGQKLSDARKTEREGQVAFVTEERKARILEARELLGSYFETVASLHSATRAREDAQADADRATLKLLTDRLADIGIDDPKAARGELPRNLDARIESLLSRAFPDADVELVDPNILESAIFDKDSFRLDTDRHTIVHTDAFREEFRARYDGRDSECVMRRAARGMWEHVRQHGIPIARGSERASSYSLLYSVMLSYIAWIVPCPEEVEARLAREFRISPDEARLRYLTGFRKASERILRVRENVDEAGLVAIATKEGLDPKGAAEVLEAGLVQDSLVAEAALPSEPVAAAIAEAAVSSGRVAVVRRRPAVVVVREPQKPAGARRTVIAAPAAPATYFSVGEDQDGDVELEPNAPPTRYLTPNALAAGLRHLGAAGEVMPSTLRMMTAMTTRF